MMADGGGGAGRTGSRPSKVRCRARTVWRSVGLRPRLLFAFFLVSLIPLTILFAAQYQHTKSSTLAIIEDNLARVTNVQHRRLNLELRRLYEHLYLVSSRTQMRISLKAYSETGEGHHLELLNRILGDALLSMEHFVGIWVRDSEDRLIAGVGGETENLQAAVAPPVYAADALPLQLAWRDGDLPHIWLSGPLVLDGEKIGSLHILAAMVDLYAVLEDFPCEDVGGETVLLLRDAAQQVHLFGPLCPERIASNERFILSLESSGIFADAADVYNSSTPVRVGGQILMIRPLDYSFGDVIVQMSLSSISRTFWMHMRSLFALVLFALALCLLMSLVLARSISRPVRVLTHATASLREGHVGVRIRERFWGEFTELTRSFNHAMRMLARRTEELNQEIETRRLSQEKLVDLANTDTLTGLMSRRHFINTLRQLLIEPGRERYPGALLYLDLDGFKPVNDRLGHEAGDIVLQVVAGRLRHLLREGDLAGRLGGDEFALLLMKNGGRTFEPKLVARRVEEQLALPMTIKNQVVSVGCSVGVVKLFPGDDPQGAINRADQAMYRVKMARRGQSCPPE